jgi:hypothetical protein
LKKHQSVLSQGVVFSTLGLAKITGQFEGYNAALSIEMQSARGRGQWGYAVFFRLELKDRVRIPFFLWPQCPIEGYKNIDLQLGGRLLSTIDYSTNFFFRKSKLDSYFSLQTNESIKNKFSKLLEVVHKIENNQIQFDKTFQKSTRRFITLLLMAASILIPLCWLAWKASFPF